MNLTPVFFFTRTLHFDPETVRVYLDAAGTIELHIRDLRETERTYFAEQLARKVFDLPPVTLES